MLTIWHNRVGMRAFSALGCLALAASSVALRAQRLPVESSHGMVASASALASEAGVAILRKGGNAVDAAVATGLALAVTYPRAGNIGGGGFAVLRMADGRAAAIDFRERAPAAATRDMYLDAQGVVVPGRSTVGHLAAGVPGTIAGFAELHQKFGSGKMSWADLIEPALRLARDGITVSPSLARDLAASDKFLSRFPESNRIFLRGGRHYRAGETWMQPDLADTLERLQKEGPREFYEGRTARMIEDDMAGNGGLITRDDLRSYRAIERDVLRGSYRGFEILTMPPPSSGGIALLQMLGMLEPHDVTSLGHNSAAKIHLFAEIMRRAFRDRAEFLGDPDFVVVPTAGLLDRDYLRHRMDDFNPSRATPSEGLAAGSLRGAPPTRSKPSAPQEANETTHFSVIDAQGGMVAVTYTLNGLFGNGVTVPGAGFLLNNEMDDFTSKIGVKNMYGLMQGEANAIAGGKRPLSSMTPTLVLKNGAPCLVTGSPGGPTIITTTLQVITNIIDHSMKVTQAVDAPRFHHQWMPDTINYEPFLTSLDSMRMLEAMGHLLTARKLYPNDPEASARYWGDAESILADPQSGTRFGASDLRSPDSGAVGY